eukprot:4452961-Amphidinium_carterae.2
MEENQCSHIGICCSDMVTHEDRRTSLTQRISQSTQQIEFRLQYQRQLHQPEAHITKAIPSQKASFRWTTLQGEPGQITRLVTVLMMVVTVTGMSNAVIVEHKGVTQYALGEVKKLILENGFINSVIQVDGVCRDTHHLTQWRSQEQAGIQSYSGQTSQTEIKASHQSINLERQCYVSTDTTTIRRFQSDSNLNGRMESQLAETRQMGITSHSLAMPLHTCYHSSCYSLRQQKQWKITVTDMQAAFLNALVDVSEVIHVKLPKEFCCSPEDQSKIWRRLN